MFVGAPKCAPGIWAFADPPSVLKCSGFAEFFEFRRPARIDPRLPLRRLPVILTRLCSRVGLRGAQCSVTVVLSVAGPCLVFPLCMFCCESCPTLGSNPGSRQRDVLQASSYRRTQGPGPSHVLFTIVALLIKTLFCNSGWVLAMTYQTPGSTRCLPCHFFVSVDVWLEGLPAPAILPPLSLERMRPLPWFYRRSFRGFFDRCKDLDKRVGSWPFKSFMNH